jgi:hypothetical protein
VNSQTQSRRPPRLSTIRFVNIPLDASTPLHQPPVARDPDPALSNAAPSSGERCVDGPEFDGGSVVVAVLDEVEAGFAQHGF